MMNIQPAEHYIPPALPTLAEKLSLCELPKRWARNAAVVACIGVLGASTLAGCFGGNVSHDNETEPHYTATTYLESTTRANHATTYRGYSDFDVNVRLSGGGGGSAWYVVFLTEQEIQGLLRTQLEAAGLRFTQTPPSYSVEVETGWGFGHRMEHIGLDWFDTGNNVGVLLLRTQGLNNLPQRVTNSFAQEHNLTVGVFEYPQARFENRDWDFENPWNSPLIPPTDEEVAAAVPKLVASINEQAQAFIAHLQNEGIL